MKHKITKASFKNELTKIKIECKSLVKSVNRFKESKESIKDKDDVIDELHNAGVLEHLELITQLKSYYDFINSTNKPILEKHDSQAEN